jgi:hypothetical protein
MDKCDFGSQGCRFELCRCKWDYASDLYPVLTAKTIEFLARCCLNFALIQNLRLARQQL